MEIELPDGTIAEFPDGTPPETIKAALQKRFPKPQEGSAGETIGRQLGLTGRYLLEGPANVAATFIGDPLNATINMGIKGVNAVNEAINPPTMSELITGREPLIPYLQKPSEMVGPALTKMGFPEPQGPLERVVGETSKFVTSIPAFAGGASQLAKIGVPGLEPLMRNMGQQLAGGAVGGAAYGTTKELTDNPLIQAGAALTGGLVGSGAVAALSEKAARKAIPSAEAIKQMSNAAYKASEDAGAIVKPEAIKGLLTNITDDLAEQAYIPLNAPKVGGVLQEIERIAQGNVTLKGLDALRQAARDVANSTDASEARLGLRMIDKIDEMVANLKPADVLQGQSDEAVNALLRARSLWGKARKAEIIDDAIENAIGRAATSGTGGNQENAIRQNLERILKNPKLRRGFTKEEIAAIKQVSRGSWTQNVLRQLGRLSPKTGALMQAYVPGAVAIDMATGAPITTTAIAAGTGAKYLADTLNRSAANRLSENIRGAVTNTLPKGVPFSQALSRLLPLGGQMQLGPGLMQLLGRPGVTNAIATGNQEK